MSCFACSKKYGLFCKEFGCANCGYSFCLKCLKKEIEVPRRKNQKQKVCLSCYEKLLSAATQASKKEECGNIELADSNPVKMITEPNEIFQITEDTATILDPVLNPIPASSAGTSPVDESINSEEIAGNLDSEILKRLRDLKKGDALPEDEELRSRLCSLKGFQPKDYSKKDILLSTDKRTEQEKINDLLKQFVEETDIDSNSAACSNNPVSEIERRLAALRDVGSYDSRNKPTVDPNTPSDNEEDDEALLKNIIQRYVDEVRLSQSNAAASATPNEFEVPNLRTEDTEELPWCTICNEDAVVRCQSCGGDLFCRTCFKECHDDDVEWRSHITQTYSRPPIFKEDHF